MFRSRLNPCLRLHPWQVFLAEHMVKLVWLPHDDNEILGPVERPEEDVLGVDFPVEYLHGDHYGRVLEAPEAGDGAVEDVVGGPQVLPVGVAVGVPLLRVDGVAALGGEQGYVFGKPAFLRRRGLRGSGTYVTCRDCIRVALSSLSIVRNFFLNQQESPDVLQPKSDSAQRCRVLAFTASERSGEVVRWSARAERKCTAHLAVRFKSVGLFQRLISDTNLGNVGTACSTRTFNGFAGDENARNALIRG